MTSPRPLDLGAVERRHADFERQYSPGADWEPMNTMHEDIRALLAVVRAQRLALAKYGRHEHWCSIQLEPAKCNCGFDAAALECGEEEK
jgi:hypothetical protein